MKTTTTQKFIEDAVKGGWECPVHVDIQVSEFRDRWILLDPLAWQAVGKTRGWNTPYYQRGSDDCAFEMSPWLAKQHRFIDRLAGGKTIEEALQAIT